MSGRSKIRDGMRWVKKTHFTSKSKKRKADKVARRKGR